MGRPRSPFLKSERAVSGNKSGFPLLRPPPQSELLPKGRLCDAASEVDAPGGLHGGDIYFQNGHVVSLSAAPPPLPLRSHCGPCGGAHGPGDPALLAARPCVRGRVGGEASISLHSRGSQTPADNGIVRKACEAQIPGPHPESL